jgi:hypothetical protein
MAKIRLVKIGQSPYPNPDLACCMDRIVAWNYFHAYLNMRDRLGDLNVWAANAGWRITGRDKRK